MGALNGILIPIVQTFPAYPLPLDTLLRLLWAVTRRRQLSFRREAAACVRRISPPLFIIPHQIEASPPCLVTVNHYNRPGFQAWWIALAVSSALPIDIHWVVTSAWRNISIAGVRSQQLSDAGFQFSRRIFPRMAQVYGFTCMPPMPPEPAETEARAAAVRAVLTHAREHPQGTIGLAPEGLDPPDGRLSLPPAGVGRLVHHLCRDGRAVLPVGLYEMDGMLCLKFGNVYCLDVPHKMGSHDLDLCVRHQLMAHIAALLPESLRGPFA